MIVLDAAKLADLTDNDCEIILEFAESLERAGYDRETFYKNELEKEKAD